MTGPQKIPFLKAEANRSQRGVAMLELALAAPVLLCLCLGLVDISRMVITHIAFTQAVREAVRQAAGNPSLEVGSYFLTVPSGRTSSPFLKCQLGATLGDCRPCVFPALPTGLNRDHQQNCLLRSIYFTLADRSGDVAIKWETLRLDSTRYDIVSPRPESSAPSAPADDDVVEFVIRAEYDGLFPPFKNGRIIEAKAVASYL